MAQSLSLVLIHLVFGTKGRAPWIHEGLRARLHTYIHGIITNHDCKAVEINSVDDHIHILLDLGRTIPLSKIVREVKASSSAWMKEQPSGAHAFAWQGGYGAFSVSSSVAPDVIEYIQQQAQHHRKMSFEEEVQLLFNRHGLEYRAEYFWMD